MAQIKRGTTPTIRVKLDGIRPEDVQSVEFIFKPFVIEEGHELLKKSYPGDVTYDETEALWLIPLTEAESRLFPQRKRVYMDTRITFPDGAVPFTNIVDFCVYDTLFGGDSA